MKRYWLTLTTTAAIALLIALTLSVSTYAWFTANKEVETEKITARTAQENLELEISRVGGEGFTPGKSADNTYNEVPLNLLVDGEGNDKFLMPVSTADLKTFVFNSHPNGGVAQKFYPTTDDKRYYHDTVYLRAVGTGLPENTKADLYLDDQFPIVDGDQGNLLAASRLGLRFDDTNFTIFKLTEAPDEGVGNTELNGVLLKGKVLDYDAGTNTVVPVDDPAVFLKNRQAGTADGKPLLTMELNKIYTVEIYFYLEGCDPDCVETRVKRDNEAWLGLPFLAVLQQEVEAS